MKQKPAETLAFNPEIARAAMIGALELSRTKLLEAAGADPVRDLRRSFRKHRKLLESKHDLVAFKAVELYDKRYGTFAPQPEVDRTPRFSVQINLDAPRPVINTMTVIGSSDASNVIDHTLTPAVEGAESDTQRVKHNGWGWEGLEEPGKSESAPPPPPGTTLRRVNAGGSRSRKSSREPDTTSPTVAVRKRRGRPRKSRDTESPIARREVQS